MSRRHKETDNKDNYKPQEMESHADGHLGVTSDNYSTGKKRVYHRFLGTVSKYLAEKLSGLIKVSIMKDEIEIDDHWLKIPLSAFGELGDGWLQQFRKHAYPQNEGEPETKKKGAHPIKQLFKKIADSKVMEYFHNTLNEVKEKCVELYENITQFSICFLHGSHKAFAPDEDPYRKLSHYLVIISDEVFDFPTRKTLSNYNYWFVNWKPVVINERPKERNERYRHGLWTQLIEWIYYYLLQIAPEYAFQMQRG